MFTGLLYEDEEREVYMMNEGEVELLPQDLLNPRGAGMWQVAVSDKEMISTWRRNFVNFLPRFPSFLPKWSHRDVYI